MGAAGEEFVVELVVQKTEMGARWVVVGTKEEMGRCEESSSLVDAENARSLDCAASFAGADDAALGMTVSGDSPGITVTESSKSVEIPWLCAEVDPNEKWWERLRGNPKRAGEISQAAFLLKAEMLGFDLALPWGDNQKFDFVVWRRDGRAFRVQVKGTGRLHRRGYEVKPVRSTRRGKKKRYTKKDIDVIAAHVQPVDAWYLIPIEKVGRAKSLRLYPGIESRSRPTLRKPRRVGHPQQSRTRMWEEWRDRWEVLE